MIDAGKEDVPGLMLVCGHRATAWERLLQCFEIGNTLNGKLTPFWNGAAAAPASDLVRKEVHCALLNAVILRLRDTKLSFIGKAQQALLMNRPQDEFMDSGINT